MFYNKQKFTAPVYCSYFKQITNDILQLMVNIFEECFCLVIYIHIFSLAYLPSSGSSSLVVNYFVDCVYHCPREWIKCSIFLQSDWKYKFKKSALLIQLGTHSPVFWNIAFFFKSKETSYGQKIYSISVWWQYRLTG